MPLVGYVSINETGVPEERASKLMLYKPGTLQLSIISAIGDVAY
jgi:hypothetical protein